MAEKKPTMHAVWYESYGGGPAGLKLVPMVLSAKGENLESLVNLVKEGKLKTFIDSKYPLSKAEDAWAKSIGGRATGKIIVEP